MPGRPKIFVLQANENWVTDVYVSDFLRHTSLQTVSRPEDADIVWLLASWCWNHIHPRTLEEKRVVCTVHHIVPEKFDPTSFMQRDRFVDVYFVYTLETANFIRRYSQKSIVKVAHWIDPVVWPVTDRASARERLGLQKDDFVVGSFQRDTEGSDLTSPKLEKGPDILCDLLERMSSTRKITLLLGGWRREYVVRRLSGNSNIEIVYRELPPQEVIRDMYAASSLYLCTSRYEGGPMCILESAVMRVPILSTRVGIADEVLHESQIFSPDTWDFTMPSDEAVEHAYRRAMDRLPKKMIDSYDFTFRHIFSPTTL